MYCWPESQLTWACDLECISGLEWIGTLHIPKDSRSCPSVVMSVSELHNSFECIFSNEGGNVEHKATHAIAVSRLHVSAYIAGANQTHRDARRRHDLKLLSLRGEATSRTPVWRSKRRSQLD